MRIRNPFKRKETVAELIEKVRPIVEKYGFPEAYVTYEGLKDIKTDRPEWIRLVLPICPEVTDDGLMSFLEEMFVTFKGRVAPRLYYPDEEQLEFARSHCVSLFS